MQIEPRASQKTVSLRLNDVAQSSEMYTWNLLLESGVYPLPLKEFKLQGSEVAQKILDLSSGFKTRFILLSFCHV